MTTQKSIMSVFVTDLPRDILEATLYSFFQAAGPVTSIHICRDVNTKKPLGYAYVNFSKEEDAQRAFEMSGKEIGGRPCHIAWVQRDPQMRKTGVASIVAKNLVKSVDLETVRASFAAFGRIMSLRVPVDPKTKEPRGIAYINFETKEQAAKAIAETNGKDIGGNEVIVEAWKNQTAAREAMKEQFTNTFTRFLKLETTLDELKEWASKCGKVTSAALRPSPDNTNCYGYVAFESHEAAAAFVAQMNGTTDHAVAGQPLVSTRFMSKRERRQQQMERRQKRDLENQKYTNLYIKHLEDSVTLEQLKEVLAKYGETVSVSIAKDTVGNPRGFGFASFKEKAAAEAAIAELQNSTFLSGTKPLYIALAQRKDVRHAQMEEARRMNFQKPGVQQGFMGQAGYGGGMGPGAMMGMGGMGGMMGFSGMQRGQGPQGAAWAQGGFPQQSYQNFALQQQQQQQLFQQQQQQQQQQQFRMLAPQQHQPQTMAAMPRPPPQAAPISRTLPAHTAGIDLTQLASMSNEAQKNFLGERLYERINASFPREASKVTGMLLEMDNAEIVNLLQDTQQLNGKIQEALDVLRKHQQP